MTERVGRRASNNRSLRLTDARGTVIGDNNSVYQYFLSEQYAPLSQKIISSSDLIEEKTCAFVGRTFVFDAIDAFMQNTSSGYFIVKGQPGIGKTALAAQLVKTRGYLHHFVVSSLGINRAEQFLESVCAQLIAKFKLDRPAWLPLDAGRDGRLMQTLLREARQRIADSERVVVVVDALDELSSQPDPRENILYLPPTLPNGVFFVITTRPRDDLALLADLSEEFHLDAHSALNSEDVRLFIIEFARRPAMQDRLLQWKTSAEHLAESLKEKAEGNFMYLHYVLPAIEAGRFDVGAIENLPTGLASYYERHWRQMRASGEDTWLTYRQPVIVFLAAAREPVTVGQIATWAKLDPRRVLAALHEWREFLDEEVVGPETKYRIYHASFQDFLRNKDAAQEIDFKRTNSEIGDRLLDEWSSLTRSLPDSQ